MKPAAFSSPFGSLISGFSTPVDDPRVLWLVLPQVVQKSCVVENPQMVQSGALKGSQTHSSVKDILSYVAYSRG